MEAVNDVMKLQKPTSVIFLDIDGVMINWDLSGFLFDVIDKINVIKDIKNTQLSHLQQKNVVSNYFSPSAINNLDNLIARVSELQTVVIVLSSHWRNGATINDLETFSELNFCRFLGPFEPIFDFLLGVNIGPEHIDPQKKIENRPKILKKATKL